MAMLPRATTSIRDPPTTQMTTRRPSLVSVRPRLPTRPSAWLQVLPGGHPLDGPAPGGAAVVAVDDGADVDDPLALLAGDLGPVVRVGRVGQVLVLLVLLVDRLDHVGETDALGPVGQVALD